MLLRVKASAAVLGAALTLCLCPPAPAALELTSTPSSPEIFGPIFMEAWLAVRRDMDGLCTAKVRAEEALSWFDAMPPFLLRDVLRLATSNEALYQAAHRLADARSPDVPRLITAATSRSSGGLFALLMDAEIVRMGDEGKRKLILKELKSAVLERRVAAGLTLAAAGETAGFAYLRGAVKKGGEEGRSAAWGLGRFGDAKDESLLKSESARRPSDTMLKAAFGELIFKRTFASAYNAYLLRFRFSAAIAASDGLYETWHTAVAEAAAAGARTIDALRREIAKQKREPTFGEDKELTDRRLAVFLDFLDEVIARHGDPSKADFPSDFQTAVDGLRRKTRTEQSRLRAEAVRIASAVALTAALGPKLGYPKYEEPTPGLSAVSPNGDRALDGNIGTSWHLRKQTPLVLDHVPGLEVRTVRIWMSCGEVKSSKAPAKITITGTDNRGKPWKRVSAAVLNRFQFQEVTIGEVSAGRVQIFVMPPASVPQACISEIRFDFN